MTPATTERTGETSRRTPRGPAGRRLGFTLVELLIALAIVLAILTLAFPFTMRMLEERELASTEESIASELIKARVRAQESGKPVEVVLVDGVPASITVRYFDLAVGRRERQSSRSTSAGGSSSERRRESSSSAPTSEWTHVSAISSSIRVEGCEPRGTSADDGTDARDAAFVDMELPAETHGDLEADAHEPLRLAVFLPDGSILFAAALMLVHDSGIQSRVTVDPWTGQPAFERAATQAGATSAAEPQAPTDERRDETRDSTRSDDAFEDIIESDEG